MNAEFETDSWTIPNSLEYSFPKKNGTLGRFICLAGGPKCVHVKKVPYSNSFLLPHSRWLKTTEIIIPQSRRPEVQNQCHWAKIKVFLGLHSLQRI